MKLNRMQSINCIMPLGVGIPGVSPYKRDDELGHLNED